MAYSGDAYKVLTSSTLSSSVQNAMIDSIYSALNALDTGKASTAAATTSAAGLMSAVDKGRLDEIPIPAVAQAGFFLGVDDNGVYALVEVSVEESSTTWGAM